MSVTTLPSVALVARGLLDARAMLEQTARNAETLANLPAMDPEILVRQSSLHDVVESIHISIDLIGVTLSEMKADGLITE